MRIHVTAIPVALLLLPTLAHAENDRVTVANLEAVQAIAQDQFDRHNLGSLIYQLRIDGEEVLTQAFGQAMTGVPATPDGHFRNGAVALAYVAAIALRLAEEDLLDLDAPIERWRPERSFMGLPQSAASGRIQRSGIPPGRFQAAQYKSPRSRIWRGASTRLSGMMVS